MFRLKWQFCPSDPQCKNVECFPSFLPTIHYFRLFLFPQRNVPSTPTPVSQSVIHSYPLARSQSDQQEMDVDWLSHHFPPFCFKGSMQPQPPNVSAVAPVSAAATRTFNKVSSNFGKLRRPTSAKISKEKHLCISLKKPPCQMRVLQYPMENMENMIQLVTNTKRYRPYVKLGAKSALPIKIFQKSMPH